MKDKMPTLQQNQKSCIPTLKANAMQQICFCSNAPSVIRHGLTTVETQIGNGWLIVRFVANIGLSLLASFS